MLKLCLSFFVIAFAVLCFTVVHSQEARQEAAHSTGAEQPKIEVQLNFINDDAFSDVSIALVPGADKEEFKGIENNQTTVRFLETKPVTLVLPATLNHGKVMLTLITIPEVAGWAKWGKIELDLAKANDFNITLHRGVVMPANEKGTLTSILNKFKGSRVHVVIDPIVSY